MTVHLYFDEDSMDHDLVRALRARGINVLTPLEAETITWYDEEQLNFATEQGRVLCTFNVRDYFRLHTEYMTEGKSHGGIIIMPQQRFSIGGTMRRLLRIIAIRSQEEMKNRIEFLSNW